MSSTFYLEWAAGPTYFYEAPSEASSYKTTMHVSLEIKGRSYSCQDQSGLPFRYVFQYENLRGIRFYG